MKTKKELLAENANLRRKLRVKRKRTITRGPSEDEIRGEARRLRDEKTYHDNYMSLVHRGLCGRCASRPCVCG